MKAPVYAATGPIGTLQADAEARLFDRGRAADPAVVAAVSGIIADVRRDGDAALLRMARRFDGVELAAVEVPRADWDAALAALDPVVRGALEQAARAIASFHRAQLPAPLEVETAPGVRVGRHAEPLGSVGVYAPGGRASYPSSVLMGVVPARVAGVGQVVVCSPPGPDGAPPAAVLAACALAGADRVFAIGGAGAVAALAFGTASVPRVDKIVGPGNAYVTEAKRQLTGQVAIDCPAGPSEVLVIADDSADPELVAAELLAQAEHDPDAAAVLVTTSPALVPAVQAAIARLLAGLPRAEISLAALAARSGLLMAEDLEQALRFAARYAPEHLLLMVREPRALLPRVRAAGTVFLGAHSSVAFGDYMTGANHVLPTAGLARAYAGLSSSDFLRWTTWQELTATGAAALAGPTAALANAEGLPAHALAARLRAGSGNTDTGNTGKTSDLTNGGDSSSAALAGSGNGAAATSNRAAPARALPGLRAAYAEIQPYDPGRRPCDIDLSDNTNTFGVCPAAAAALAGFDPAHVTRYPSVYANRLKEALAELHGVAPENIATGCGSDDVLDSAMRAFAEPGDRLAYPDPTFGVVPTFGRMNAMTPVAVPLTPALELDEAALLATEPRLLYVCSPNNPTGTVVPAAAIERLAAAVPGVMLLDEAYADFADSDFARAAAASDRLISVRTMSKAFGLAGLRVGYAIGPARLIREVEKSRGPYKVGGVAEAAALAVLSSGMDWVRGRVANVIENRAALGARLTAGGFKWWPSGANFLLVAVPAGGARDWSESLRGRGVAVRPFVALPRLGECLRVSIGPWPMLERFVDALEDVRAHAQPGKEA